MGDGVDEYLVGVVGAMDAIAAPFIEGLAEFVEISLSGSGDFCKLGV